MKILAFEFLSGGGVADQYPLDASLAKFQKQGSQMLDAVCEDFLKLGHEVILPMDIDVSLGVGNRCEGILVSQQAGLEDVLLSAAANVDAILVVCPESGGCLENFLGLLSPWSEKLISPDLDFVRLTGNKWRCFQWLDDQQVPCPKTIAVSENGEFAKFPDLVAYPMVAKPIDGAGSENVTLVASEEALSTIKPGSILQEYSAGLPSSVSVIAKQNGDLHYCEPGEQIFGAHPFGPHLRTRFPLSGDQRARALRLAHLVVEALPPTRGYFGIDMVLGDRADQDVVIEINPRLTTSYCDLRKWNDANLAQVMLN